MLVAGCERISSVEQLLQVRAAFGGLPLEVVVLREEPFAVADDYPISLRGPKDWWLSGLPYELVAGAHKAWVTQIRGEREITLVNTRSLRGKQTSDPPEVRLVNPNVRTVEEIVRAAGCGYHWVPTTDHTRPTRAGADRFIGVVRAIPRRRPVLFLCNGGRGRTTLHMIMYDMLRNALQVSAMDIIVRQCKLSHDYNMLDHDKAQPHKRKYREDRVAFIFEFHDFARHSPDGWPHLYSEWRLIDSEEIHKVGAWDQQADDEVNAARALPPPTRADFLAI